MPYLTKSRFVHALDCPTKLFYKESNEHISTEVDNPFLEALAEGGLQVGELAKLYYPEGIEITARNNQDALEQTADQLDKADVTLFEGAINYRDTLARVDILKKSGNKIDLMEVKSKSWSSEDSFLKGDGYIYSKWQKYLYDVAFQTWVFRKAYPEFTIKPYLMLIDKDQPATVGGLHQYFKVIENDEGRSEIKLTEDLPDIELGEPILTEVDVSGVVQLILEGEGREPKSELEAKGFDEWVIGLSDYLQQNKKYPVKLGKKCKNCEHRVPPDLRYDKQTGFDECWQEALGWSQEDLLKPHAFDVWYASAKRLIEDEVYLMEELTPAYYGVDDSNLYTKDSFENGRDDRKVVQIMKTTGRHDTDEVLLSGLEKEMGSWNYPLHFIDFEGIAPAIPFHEGSYPYKKVPFQFSMHNVYENGDVEHVAEWIDDRRGVYPSFDFLRALKEELENDDGSVFMYHHYEKTTLRDVRDKLKESSEPDKDELIDWINTLILEGADRELIDQQKLVVNHYYSPHMKGSNSIKDVLPAVLNESDYLEQEYSKPYSGLSIKNTILYQTDETGKVQNPYDQLEPIGHGLPSYQEGEAVLEASDNNKIKDGGTAMIAWARMQFPDVSDEEREAVFNALLKYCELDTLAMVMIHQHWKSIL